VLPISEDALLAADAPERLRSSNPDDLLRELETVLRRVPPLLPSPGLMRQPSIDPAAGDDVSPSSDSDSPHGSSSVMDDLMQAHEVVDYDGADECPSPRALLRLPSGKAVPSLDPELQDLDMLLRTKESAGQALRFKRTHPPPVALSPGAASLLAPSPPLPVPSPVTPCDPGTILFERGKTYALIGQNRSGKSTLMQILCKLHSPAASDCDIELNGGDFLSMPRMALRDRISYVAQRPFIFPGTIADNIRVGNSAASDADVQRAAEMAGIFSLEKPKPILGPADAAGKKSLVDRTGMKIQLKPWEQNRLKSVALAAGSWMYNTWMGLHGFEQEDTAEDDAAIEVAAKLAPAPASAASSASAVPSSPASTLHPTLLLETAERGTNLSGGFAQSVALARVFLRTQAQIVILDESMGQMDALKKREVIFPTLFRFVKEHRMTLILISHDVAQVCKLVDHVYVLASGQLVQSGSHAELMADAAGVYARLVAAQE